MDGVLRCLAAAVQQQRHSGAGRSGRQHAACATAKHTVDTTAAAAPGRGDVGQVHELGASAHKVLRLLVTQRALKGMVRRGGGTGRCEESKRRTDTRGCL